MKKFLLIILLFSFSKSYSQTATNSGNPLRLHADSLKWVDAKPPMPPGAKIALMEGNPKEAGHFTFRVKLPAHYTIPPHRHPVDERTTIISGTMYVGLGTVVDTSKATRLAAGGFYLNPAGGVHYACTGSEETIVQISSNGPWGSLPPEEKFEH